MTCKAVKASITKYCGVPAVQRIGSKGGSARLKTIALKNMKERNWTILRGVLNLSKLRLILLLNFAPL